MKKVYYLKSCSTCQKIIKEHSAIFENFDMQNIKVEKITKDDLAFMRRMTNSYESLFSKRSQSYKKLNLKDKHLSEDDMKNFILDDYTFLKRPVIIDEDFISIGSEKSSLEKLNNHFTQ